MHRLSASRILHALFAERGIACKYPESGRFRVTKDVMTGVFIPPPLRLQGRVA
jgi:hypothetical protein